MALLTGRISQRSIDEVRARADLVDLVESRSGPGRRSSGNVLFRCPFHDERTGSFSVEPVAKLYHCFGCGAKGSVVDFVMRIEGLQFVEAIEWLAHRYGVELEREAVDPQQAAERARRGRLDALLEDAATYYQRFLASASEAAPARDYLAERRVSAESIERFRIGMAPADWDQMVRAARTKGYTDSELAAAGLSTAGRRGPIDRFRGRIMFPLADGRGRVRGFGARIMPGNEGPKYLNSPESDVFHKSRILYAMHLARASIARSGRAIVVEGYTDVIAMHAVGETAAVASMGTALTEEQVRDLRSLAPRVVLCFDADAAGQEAALRGMAIAERARLDVRVASLPPGKDPGDLLQDGVEAFREVVAGAESVLSFRISHALARVPSAGPDTVYRDVKALLLEAQPGPDRDDAVRRVAGALRLRPDSTAALVPIRGPQTRSLPGAGPPGRSTVRHDRESEAQIGFLAACLAAPGIGRGALAETRELLDPELAPLVGWVAARLDGRHEPAPPAQEGLIAEVAAGAARLADEGEEAAHAALAANRIGVQVRNIDIRIAELKNRLNSDDNTSGASAGLERLKRERVELLDDLRRGRPRDGA